MPTLIEAPISAEFAINLLDEINNKGWWQGALISAKNLPVIHDGHDDVEWWVIASQACNIYNHCFSKVPVIELVAANKIAQCDTKKSRGDNPRILHVEAHSAKNEIIFLELNIQRRRWMRRALLAELPAPIFYVRDSEQNGEQDGLKSQWLDALAGWLGRSYTRVALPDEFNDVMKSARLSECLEDKLSKHKDALYGIYISLGSADQTPWKGVLGKMPPPYLLSIVLVAHETAAPDEIKAQLVQQIFSDKIQDPHDNSKKITRAELARRHNLRLIENDIEARSVSDITLLELKSLIRYSLVDHLSDSSVAVI